MKNFNLVLEQFRQSIAGSVLEPLADRMCATAIPKIAISLEQVAEDEAALPLACSKVGGYPDVPVGFEYPEHDGISLSFLAQFDLEEVSRFDVEKKLPDTGRKQG
jgi:uncharacterized protein YwqG